MKRSGFQKPLMVVVVSAIAFVNFGFFKSLTDVAKKATEVLENAGGEVKGNNAQGYTTAELEDFCRRQGVDLATVKEGDVRVAYKFNKALAKTLRELEWTEQRKEREELARQQALQKATQEKKEREEFARQQVLQKEAKRKKEQEELARQQALQKEAEEKKYHEEIARRKKQNDEIVERELPGIISEYEEEASSIAECINTNLHPYIQFIHFMQNDSNKELINRVDLLPDENLRKTRCDELIEEYNSIMSDVEKAVINFYSYNSDYPGCGEVNERIFTISTNKIIKSNVRFIFDKYKERLVGERLKDIKSSGYALAPWYKDKVVRVKRAIEKAKKNVEVIQQEDARKIRLSKEYITMPENEKFPLLSVQSKPLDFMKDIKSGVAAKWLEGYLLANKIEYKKDNDSITAEYPSRTVDFCFYKNALLSVRIIMKQSISLDSLIGKYTNVFGSDAEITKRLNEFQLLDSVGDTVTYGRIAKIWIRSKEMSVFTRYPVGGAVTLPDELAARMKNPFVDKIKKVSEIEEYVKKSITKEKDADDLSGAHKIEMIWLRDRKLSDYETQEENREKAEAKKKADEENKAKEAAALDF